jgi:hypothetical protein
MESLQYVKPEDRVQPPATTGNGQALQLDRLLGIWLNTNSSSQGIVKIMIEARGPALIVRALGAGDPSPCDWGETQAEHIYANSISSNLAAGFTAWYHSDFSATHLQANWNQGLLVLASLTSFKDGSNRSNYFSREFFHL